MKDQRVEADKSQQNQFDSKSRIGVILCRFCPEEQETADEHRGKAGPREWEDRPCETSDGDRPQNDSEHAKVQQRYGPHQRRDPENMDRLDDGESIIGLAYGGSNVRVI